ncbi:MAG: peptidoglycan-binding domain-containing protein [Candidatus Omnitrophota bacterium]
MKKLCSQKIIGILVLAACLHGCDFIYGLLQHEGAEEKKILGEIVPFTDNERVYETQELLKVYGFNPGKADGRMGPNTREALEGFQRANHLKVSRFVDKKTWVKLNFLKEADLVLDGEINIKTVQIILKEAGYDPGKMDGKVGQKTKEALLAFQKDNGLKPDGIIGSSTLNKLIEFLPAR